MYKLILLFAFCSLNSVLTFQVPDVKLELLPKGFRVSIPDLPGVQFVAFNINRNRRFKGFEPGEYSVQVSEPVNNRWIYENTQRNFGEDDVIYIWTNVQYKQYIYRRVSDPIVIEKPEITYNNNHEAVTTSTESNIPNVNVITTEEPYVIDIRRNDNKCAESISKIQNKHVCKGDLLFEDNFDGGLNLSRWQYEVRLALDVGDAEFVLYDNEVDNIHVANGMLTIVPTLWNDDKPGTDVKQGIVDLGLRCTSKQNILQECRSQPDGNINIILPPVKTARINTKDFFSFKYGRVDIRAKIPNGDWIFPLLLLEPLRNNYGSANYASGQLRIAFARGNNNLQTQDGEPIDGRTLYGGAVLSTDPSLREKFYVKTRRNIHFANDFHTYSMIWTHEKIILLVDDQEYGSISGGFEQNDSSNIEYINKWKRGEFMAPFDQEFFITLGVSVGGHGDFPDGITSQNRNKPWVNTSPKAAYRFWRDRFHWKTTWTKPELQVDFVRVYAI